MWNFDLPKPVFHRTKLEDFGPKIKQTEWNAYFIWFLEAFKCVQNPKIPLYKILIQVD